MAQYTENTSGIIAAINACIAAAGGTVTAYTNNTAGVIAALLDLKTAIGESGSAETVEEEVTAGETLLLGHAVYLHTDGKIYKATPSGTRAQATVFGLAKAGVATDETVTLVISGYITEMSGLTAGAEYFVAASGAISTTVPSASGSYVTRVGQAQSATIFSVNPAQPVLLT
jgi:hypothetical protein